MTIDPATLDQWQAVCDAATAEPWSTEAIFDGKHETEVCAEPTIDTGNPNMIGHFVDDSPEEKQAQRDAYFCALARTALPLAIAALREHTEAFKTMRNNILNADANMLNNDQINYVLGIVDDALPAPPAQNAAQGVEG